MSDVVGYTTGVFDLFHIGHLNLLKAAREQCDRLIVGVATDELAFDRKGASPVFPFLERCEIVRNIRSVDQVVTYARTNDLEDWRRLGFKRMFKGSDWKGHPRWAQLAQVDVDVIFLPYTEDISTTLLRKRLQGAIMGSLIERKARETAEANGAMVA
jgi:glycerol-3-phosphate cytidylyltransferase